MSIYWTATISLSLSASIVCFLDNSFNPKKLTQNSFTILNVSIIKSKYIVKYLQACSFDSGHFQKRNTNLLTNSHVVISIGVLGPEPSDQISRVESRVVADDCRQLRQGAAEGLHCEGLFAGDLKQKSNVFRIFSIYHYHHHQLQRQVLFKTTTLITFPSCYFH